MPSTYTSRNRLTLQGSGENESTWGDIVNTVLELVDDSLDGILDLDITLGNETLTAVNGADDESRNRFIRVVNAHTGDRQVILPDVEKIYYVSVTQNNGGTTTFRNASDLTGITLSGAGVSNSLIYCDGVTTEFFLNLPDALLASNNLSDVDDAADARDNLDVYSRDEIDSGGTALYPVGLVMAWPGAAAPARHLLCHGQVVSRTTYADLFAVCGTLYGIGDGSTTFNLPDLRGYFVRGLDAGRGVDVGRVIGSSQDDAFQGHHHANNALRFSSFTQPFGSGNYSPDPSAASVTDPITDGTNGTPRTASETRPKNVAMNYIIYTGVV